MSKNLIKSGTPYKLGAVSDANGVNFAVFSENASKMELCLFSDDGETETNRIPLPEKTGPVWHGYVPGLSAGAVYGYRAHGSYEPERGHRFNPNKLLLDPYTRQLHGAWKDSSQLLGYVSNDGDLSYDTRDSAPFVAKSVVPDPELFQKMRRLEKDPDRADLIYEAHVKGLTMGRRDIPDVVRGTFEGLASEPMLEHLQNLGVTAVELLPVHAFLDDNFLIEKGLVNYWGYNSIGFFAPEPRYFGPAGICGFRDMVARFHKAGIEVMLDVVFNHTAEGGHLGPTLSFRGLDNASYYRLLAGQPRYYVNDTGCGNTLNIAHPYVLRMVLDSLRFWVEYMGIDGFRFDLATTLGREDHGFDPNGGFFDALRQDPVLSGVRLTAEPWDIGPGGYRLGEFPHEFSEWNDTFRDTVRRYWRGDAHSTQELGARLLGSADKFDRNGRRAWSSVNFLASHDGFTLADTTRYEHRHNLANGEENRDGHHSNYSDNCGVEGQSDDAEILARRDRRQRNMLATLFLSQGTPMLLAGDEVANSQAGNNNAYCQDNEIGWIDWENDTSDLGGFVAALSEFRKDHPALRQSRFLHGATRARDGHCDVEWSDFNGQPLQWRDSSLSNLCLTLRHSAEAPEFEPDDDMVFLIFNRDEKPAEVMLPPVPDGFHWVRRIDTAQGNTSEISHMSVNVADHSVTALALEPELAEKHDQNNGAPV